jgi:hypothetical protein
MNTSQADLAPSQNADAHGASIATHAPAPYRKTPVLCASKHHPVGAVRVTRAAVVKMHRAAVAVLSNLNLNLNASNRMKLVEFLRARTFEDPFIMHGEKWQFVTVLRADGAEDIGVYRFATDLCYDYSDFRALFNLA